MQFFVRILLALRISEIWGGRAAKIGPPRAAALAFPYLTKKHAKKHAKITVFGTLFGPVSYTHLTLPTKRIV